jgi:hypothetical protein
MDAIDHALTEAWAKLAPTLRRDRVEAVKRAARLGGKFHGRPLRAWCCCVRASDTRLAEHGEMDPADAERWREEHMLYVPAERMRALCAPVHIPWPGLRLRDAAARLGSRPRNLEDWMTHGTLQVRTQAPSTVGSRGKPVPFVWSTSPLNPCGVMGRGPHSAWGTLWESMHEEIPDGASIDVKRVHAMDVLPKATPQSGWRFICPGVHGACGKPVERLYLPIAPWTIHHALSGVPRSPAGTRWACRGCHRVLNISFTSVKGWNAFIAQMSGGLLYGKEVARPAGLEDGRRYKFARKPRKSA